MLRGFGAGDVDLHLDASVAHPKPDDLANAATTPLFVAAKRSAEKRVKYGTIVKQIGAQFLPFVFEALGALPRRFAT